MPALKDLAAYDDDDPTPCRDRVVRIARGEPADLATAVFSVTPELLAAASAFEGEASNDQPEPPVRPSGWQQTAKGRGVSGSLARTLQSPVMIPGSAPLPSLASDDEELGTPVRDKTVVMSETRARQTAEMVRAALADTDLVRYPRGEAASAPSVPSVAVAVASPPPFVIVPAASLVTAPSAAKQAALEAQDEGAPESFSTLALAVVLGLSLAFLIGSAACYWLVANGYVRM